MATVERRTRPGSDRVSWRVRWRDPDGRERSKTFPRAGQARAHATIVEKSMLDGAYVDPSAGKITVRAYAEAWRARQVWRPSTAAQVEAALRLHIYPTLGHRPIGAVKRSEIEAWVKGLTDTLKPRTVTIYYRHLAAIFRSAAAEPIIARTPCTDIKLPAVDGGEVHPLRVDQVEALLTHVYGDWYLLLLLGATAGLRSGEALGLTWDRVDLDARTVRIDRQAITPPAGPTQWGPVKTARSARTIPLPQLAVDELTKHRPDAGGEGLLVPGRGGRPRHRAALTTTMQAAVKRARAAGVVMPAAVRFHDLRHFYASLLIEAGESVKVVQRRLGHTSASVTLDVYGHLWPEVDDRTRAAVDDRLVAPVRPEVPVRL